MKHKHVKYDDVDDGGGNEDDDEDGDDEDEENDWQYWWDEGYGWICMAVTRDSVHMMWTTIGQA